MLNFLLILTFISVIFILFSIYLLIFHKQIMIQDRLKNNVQNLDPLDDFENDKRNSSIQTRITQFFGRILPHKRYILKYKVKLAKANILMKPEEFFVGSLVAGLVIVIVLYNVSHQPIIAALGFFIGYKLPDIFLTKAKNKRAKKLNDQLPEALSIISNGLRAGYSFTQAMASASKDLQAPIANEFQKVIRDNSLGKPLEESLLAVSERTEDEDMDMFITALIIQKQVGGNLSEVLDTISNTIRERIKIKGEIKILMAQGKFSAIVMSVLPVGLTAIIMMINPGYLNTLIENKVGIAVIIVAVIMNIMGILILRKIVTVKI